MVYQNALTRPVSGRLNLTGMLAMAGIIGPIILIITDIVVASFCPGYNYLRHSISSLAWARLGWLQTIGFLTIGLLVQIFVAGLFFNIRGVRGFGLGIGLLGCFGFLLLLIGAFHTDPVVGPYTVEGTIHGCAAQAVFWILPAASLLMAPSLRKDPYWHPLFIYSIVSAIFALIFMIGSLVWPAGTGWFGLFERILVLDEIVWVGIMAIWLFRLSLRYNKNENH